MATTPEGKIVEVPGDIRVERSHPSATHALRQRVLRPSQRVEDVALPGETHPQAAAFVARDQAGEVVGTALVWPEPFAGAGAGRAWRLRAMATSPDRRGEGIGSAVLGAVLAHVGRAGGELVWCHARVPAQRFYERHGFDAHGDAWDEPDLGPHVLMSRPAAPVASAEPRPGR